MEVKNATRYKMGRGFIETKELCHSLADDRCRIVDHRRANVDFHQASTAKFTGGVQLSETE